MLSGKGSLSLKREIYEIEKYLFNFKVFERLAKQGNNVTRTKVKYLCLCVCPPVSVCMFKTFFFKVRTSLNSIETIISLLASPRKGTTANTDVFISTQKV